MLRSQSADSNWVERLQLDLFDKRRGTGQAGPLRSSGGVQGKRARQPGVGASRRRRVFDGEEDGAAQEEGWLSDSLWRRIKQTEPHEEHPVLVEKMSHSLAKALTFDE